MILLDTHVLVWLVSGNTQLGSAAREAIDAAASNGEAHVSAISIWEIALLARKGRLVLGGDTRAWIASALSLPGVDSMAIDQDIAIEAALLPEPFHNDPADRFLVATVRRRGLSLMTADRAILDYGAAGHLRTISALK